MTSPPTPHITLLLKTTKSAINHALYTPETLNFISGMVLDDFIGSAFEIRPWVWHRPLLGENPYLGICLTDFNKIRYITFFSYFYVRNGQTRITTTPISQYTILNYIWFFHFPLCKSSNNECIGVKLCVNNTFKVCHLVTKNFLNRTKTVQPPRYWICGPQCL